MTMLLDGNALIALVVSDHIHHESAEAWLSGIESKFASCPMTQGSLVRLLVRQGELAATATEIVGAIGRDSRHEFWPDTVSFADVAVAGVVGHRQVTDAYLAQLARTHNGRLATFDRGLADLHSDVADLIPTA